MENKTFFIILILVGLLSSFVLVAGCISALAGDDGKVIEIGHEGFDKVYDHLIRVNDAKGSALTYELQSIQDISGQYYIKLSPLKPDTDKGKNIRRIMMDFFDNAGNWAKYYKMYQSSGKYSDLDQANLYKAKMMNAVSEFNNL